MSKFIVTGATGFIGSHLCKELLNRNHKVAIICRENSNLQLLNDIMDKIEIFYFDDNLDNMINFFIQTKAAGVFHIAGLTIIEHKPNDINSLIDSNIKFSTQILEAMKVSGMKKIINTGTCLQHYSNEKYNPSCLYAATKKAFEDILKYYVEAYKFQSITLTLFNVYGKKDFGKRLLSVINHAAINNLPLEMTLGYQKIDLVYIDDVVDAYIYAFELFTKNFFENNQCYGVSSKQVVTLRELVSIFEEENKVSLNIKWGYKHYRFRENFIPWSDYTPLPGWNSKVTLQEGVKKIYK